MKAAAHLSKIKIMVDSDVVIINRPHGCLLVASAEFGLHVTHVTLFFPSWTEGRFERTLHIWGCSLDTTFNTLNYWDHVRSFGIIHINPKTNPSSKKLIGCGVQCNLQTQEQMFSRGCWNGLVEFQQRSYRSACRAKSMGRAHVYCSVWTYLNYSRKKMKVVFQFFLKDWRWRVDKTFSATWNQQVSRGFNPTQTVCSVKQTGREWNLHTNLISGPKKW